MSNSLARKCPSRVAFSTRTFVVAVGFSLLTVPATFAEEQAASDASKSGRQIQYHENSIGMKLALIPAGKFRMGSNGFGSTNKPVHDVTISKPFYMGTTEVTQKQWHAVMGTRPWKGRYRTKEGDDYPAIYVDRVVAAEFCKRLSKKEGKTYRLPTEAEWEYACRAGTTTRFSFGDSAKSLNDYAWTEHNKGAAYPKEVAKKKPNPWGLYDMHGNVDEWISDMYGKYPDKHVTDPTGPTEQELDPSDPPYWMWRGGNFESRYYHCASASRHADIPIDYVRERNSLGFRVVLEHKQPKTNSGPLKKPAAPANESGDSEASSSDKRIQYHKNSIGMKLALIPAGKFRMGSNRLSDRESPAHDVTISKPFYIGTTEVTQGQWLAVMGSKIYPWKGEPYCKEGKDYAAAFIHPEAAVEFCKRLSKKEGKTYRLPTEAEWEYACRAGTRTRYSFGNPAKINDYAWTIQSYKKGEDYAHKVAQKKPNPWGLYDMHGNVYEWCSDLYGKYPNKHVIDPTGPKTGEYWTQRGGGWYSNTILCASGVRGLADPNFPSSQTEETGFRVVLEQAEPKASTVPSAR